MDIFEEMEKRGHEEVNFFYESDFDMKAIVAIHNSNLGKAFGPTRIGNYVYEEEAIADAITLSHGETLSASISNCDLGGAFGILIKDEENPLSEGYLRAYGRFLQTFGKRIGTMTGVGLTQEDMLCVAKEFKQIYGLPSYCGGLGDPHYYIAYGVLCGMRACAAECFGNSTLEKKKILIHGLNYAGLHLVKMLAKEGSEIFITDDKYDNVKRVKDEIPQVQIVHPDEYHNLQVDIFAPCSYISSTNVEYIDKKMCKIIAGTSKVPLETEVLSEAAKKNGILYIPDFVINAAEMIYAYSEINNFDSERVKKHIEKIYDIVLEVISKAKENNETTSKVAEEMGWERLNIVRKLRKIYTGAF